MKGLLPVQRFVIPDACISQAYRHMRDLGRKNLEGVALFVGKLEGTICYVHETLIPKQVSIMLHEGLLYAVGEEELYRLAVYLYKKGLRLIAQIHSHPKEAYHSETDDAYPIITVVGGLSIVVPDFATKPASLSTWAVYRLNAENQWVELGMQDKTNLITISND
jgi:proteasome lid subunit RPN8/RPN11